MKHVKIFEEFNLFDKAKTEFLCRKYLGSFNRNIGMTVRKNWIINKDGTVDVIGNVMLAHQKFKKLPIKFGRITGNFDCSYNELETLEGSPKIVSGYFNCSYNKLKTLEGGPKSCEYIEFSHNDIWTFEGYPRVKCVRAPEYNPVSRVFGTFCSPIGYVSYNIIELFNDYDIIREIDALGDNEEHYGIIISRLNDFLSEIDKTFIARDPLTGITMLVPKKVKKVDGYDSL